MRDACERIAGFLAGMDVEAFRADQRTIRAVLYDLVVLGEAAKGIKAWLAGPWPSTTAITMERIRPTSKKTWRKACLCK